jgi:murein DD-endopeptidase MepM/ murein hydrolase activator NlpD
MRHPVDKSYYDANDPFGNIRPSGRAHTGSDYGVRTGTAVMHVAPASKVWAVGNNPGNGNYVCVYVRGYDDRFGGQGLFVAYIHLSEISVSVGEEIGENTRIGWSGNTGTNSLGPHLHVTMSNNERAFLGLGQLIDPYAFIESEIAKPVTPPKPVEPVAPAKPLTDQQRARRRRLKLRKEIEQLKKRKKLQSIRGKTLLSRLSLLNKLRGKK